MDWYPLLNSLRIAAISAVVVFFTGIAAAYYIAKLPRLVKGILDVILTLPLVLPPTVVGYLLLRMLGPKRLIGAWVLEVFGIRLVMTWWSAIFATVVVVFPLMYRTIRGAFEAFDDTLALKWVLVNIGISAVILLVINMLEKKNLLSDFDGPILWVSHDLGECCRNCRTVCVMENGASGAVTDMESLVRRPATQSAARLTGCRNFLSARSCEGGVRLDGWDITLPLSTRDGTCTVAIPDSAVSLGAGPYRAQVFRTILDLNEASVLLRPTWDAAGPLLRVSAPKAAAPVEGTAVAFDLLPEQCLCYR